MTSQGNKPKLPGKMKLPFYVVLQAEYDRLEQKCIRRVAATEEQKLVLGNAIHEVKRAVEVLEHALDNIKAIEEELHDPKQN